MAHRRAMIHEALRIQRFLHAVIGWAQGALGKHTAQIDYRWRFFNMAAERRPRTGRSRTVERLMRILSPWGPLVENSAGEASNGRANIHFSTRRIMILRMPNVRRPMYLTMLAAILQAMNLTALAAESRL